MGKYSKLLKVVLSGHSDSNIDFSNLCRLLIRLEFEERVRGSHHIFTREGVDEIINIQAKDGKAKAYQVKQVRTIVVKHRLGGTHVD